MSSTSAPRCVTLPVVLVALCMTFKALSSFASMLFSRSEMDVTLSGGDTVLMDTLIYQVGSPKRGDVIAFKPNGSSTGHSSIKRVIGLPGETVQIHDGNIYINGKQLKEDYGRETIRNPGLASEAVTLGEDEYFVLGDNRNNSADSREPSVGNIQKKDILGRAWLRI